MEDIARIGDIDHLVATPAGLWVIETKHGRIPKAEFPETLRIAANVEGVREWAPDARVTGCLVFGSEEARGSGRSLTFNPVTPPRSGSSPYPCANGDDRNLKFTQVLSRAGAELQSCLGSILRGQEEFAAGIDPNTREALIKSFPSAAQGCAAKFDGASH